MSDYNQEVEAAISGRLLSSWFPVGAVRQIIFVFLLLCSFLNVVYGNFYLGLACILLVIFMSPRMVGELFFFVGRISRFFKK